MNNKSEFLNCEICGVNKWSRIYKGSIRDGAYGGLLHNAYIMECGNCGVQRLREKDCIPSSYYESGDYRKKLKQSLSSEKALIEQDNVQKFMIQSIGGNEKIRGKFVADVGCGVGSLLDAVSKLSEKIIGVEPCEPFINSLEKRGYEIFSSINGASSKYKGEIDLVLCSQVIEHVDDPKIFLEEIFEMLKKGGRLIISTPNRKDILMSLLPEFKSFFYRTQHRWYFDEDSFYNCVKQTDFKIKKIDYIHRYGMANAIEWLRVKKPTGNNRLDKISILADDLWSTYLNNSGMSDNMFIHLMK